MKDIKLEKKAKERIIEATLQIIKTEGLAGISIRKIAKLADVNVAAINYHYGSKENIINEAIGYLMEKFDKSFAVLSDKKLSAQERLIKFIKEFIHHYLCCPDAFRGSVLKMIKDEALPSALMQIMKDNYQKLNKVIGELTDIKDQEIINMKVFQLFSSIVHPLVIGQYAYKFWGVDFTKTETRDKYIDLILNNIKNI
ncbi:MAG: TetR/AcrR family transcriptional regulator [Candidatus Buchananbacteria bacterium]